MSVESFANALVESELNFTNIDIDNFLQHVKALGRIVERVTKNTRRSVRERKFNSMYSKQLFESMKYDPKYCSQFFQFSDSSVQIDICIRNKKYYYVSVCGNWRPKQKNLEYILNLENFNVALDFDFSSVEEMKESNGIFSFYGGKDFPLSEIGLRKARKLWFVILSMYISREDV